MVITTYLGSQPEGEARRIGLDWNEALRALATRDREQHP
jgi:hypothetical protein